jgi:ATP-dependent Lon protease
VKTVLIPAENEKDLADVPDSVKSGLEIIPVGHIDQVLAHALTGPIKAIEWSEEDDDARIIPPVDPLAPDTVITH